MLGGIERAPLRVVSTVSFFASTFGVVCSPCASILESGFAEVSVSGLRLSNASVAGSGGSDSRALLGSCITFSSSDLGWLNKPPSPMPVATAPSIVVGSFVPSSCLPAETPLSSVARSPVGVSSLAAAFSSAVGMSSLMPVTSSSPLRVSSLIGTTGSPSEPSTSALPVPSIGTSETLHGLKLSMGMRAAGLETCPDGMVNGPLDTVGASPRTLQGTTGVFGLASEAALWGRTGSSAGFAATSGSARVSFREFSAPVANPARAPLFGWNPASVGVLGTARLSLASSSVGLSCSAGASALIATAGEFCSNASSVPRTLLGTVGSLSDRSPVPRSEPPSCSTRFDSASSYAPWASVKRSSSNSSSTPSSSLPWPREAKSPGNEMSPSSSSTSGAVSAKLSFIETALGLCRIAPMLPASEPSTVLPRNVCGSCSCVSEMNSDASCIGIVTA